MYNMEIRIHICIVIISIFSLNINAMNVIKTSDTFSGESDMYGDNSSLEEIDGNLQITTEGADVCECKNGFCEKDDKGGMVCKCPPEWGIYPISPGASRECKKCDCGKDANCTFKYGVFQNEKECMCKVGYKEVRGICKGDCNRNPCKNRGTCKKIGDDISCICTDSYFGDYCEKKCKCENGKCAEKAGEAVCICYPEYGRYAESVCNACDCGPGANCTFDKGWTKTTKTCLCPKGFAERNGKCEDICNPNPCQNAGKCSAVNGEVSCKCQKPYFGDFCNKDPCSNKPCKNGATCQIEGEGFKCICRDSYSGKLCDKIQSKGDSQLVIYPNLKSITTPSGKYSFIICSGRSETEGKFTDMKWYDNNGEIVPESSPSLQKDGNNLVLKFREPRVEDSGTYRCTAVFNNNITLEASIEVEFYESIKFSDCPDIQNLVKDQEGRISCKITYNPTPYIKWVKDNKPIMSDRMTIDALGISISSVTTEDSGNYFVTAHVKEAGIGSGKGIEVNVLTPPRIHELPEKVVLLEGEEYTISCGATGSEPLNYLWLDPSLKDLSTNTDFVVENSRLTIKNAHRNSGGHYSCKVTNPVGEDQAEFLIEVQDMCSSYKCNNGGICREVNKRPRCFCMSPFSGEFCEKELTSVTAIPTTTPIAEVNITSSYTLTSQQPQNQSTVNDFTPPQTNSVPTSWTLLTTLIRRTEDDTITTVTASVTPDICSLYKCKNGGICREVNNRPRCFCMSPFSGEFCEKDPCTSKPCVNGGTCMIQNTTFHCSCNEPYTGVFCESDPCTRNPCHNGGTCFLSGMTFKCICKEAYNGDKCESSIVNTRYILTIAGLSLLIATFSILMTCMAFRSKCLSKNLDRQE